MAVRLKDLGQVPNRVYYSTRGRAPIAAEFEDCSQCFDRLSSVMEANLESWEPYQITLNDYRSRFGTWGVDTGSRSRTIDHTLRKSSQLRREVLELLEHLHASLQHLLDLVETTATPMLAPPTSDLTVLDYFDWKKKVNETSLQPETILEHRVQPDIEAIAEIFDGLTRIVPSICDPLPWDNYQESGSKEGLEIGIEFAKRMFRNAPPHLVERLGYAYWKRNLYLKGLRERAQPDFQRTKDPTSKRLPKLDFQLPTSIPFRAPKSEKNIGIRHPSKPEISPHSFFNRKASTAFTDESTTLTNKSGSLFNVESTLGTSIADTEEDPKPYPAPQPERYRVPKPPTTLELHKYFICPYCLYGINFGDEEHLEEYPSVQKELADEWANHVYTDLEPYMCTFQLCPREQKTYGSKDEWFRHELNTHRIPKVYFCQACEVHDSSLKPEELAVIASMCERFSQNSLKELACNICHEIVANTELLRDHIADHLEQFALSSIKDEALFEDDLPQSPQFSGSISERRFRLHSLGELGDLELMVEEQIEPILQQSSPVQSLGTSMPATHIETVTWSAMNNAMRPAMGRHKDSYTITSRVKEHIDQYYALAANRSNKSTLGDSMNVDLDQSSNAMVTPSVIRTGLAPRRAEFEGRIQNLKELHSTLSKPGHTCLLRGAGGIGKSALAAEYSSRFSKEYGYVFWIQAETPIVCADGYAAIAAKTVPEDEGGSDHDQERLIMLSREFLEKATKRWLLVFDNVDEWLDLKKFLPRNFTDTSGSILITTQKLDLNSMTNWPGITQINLECLSLDESRRLLLKYTRPGLGVSNIRLHPEFKLAGEVAKLAERLPLALSLIAGYILASNCSLSDFIELWNERRQRMQRKGETSSSVTDAALETAWNLGLEEVSENVRDVLNILAFLDPDTIQEEMLIGKHEEKILQLLHSAESRRIRRMTAQLSQRKLITVEHHSGEEVWSIHRTLQAKILQYLNLDNQKKERTYKRAFLLIRKRFPPPSPIQVPEPSKWPACRRYLPHVLSLRRIFSGSTLQIEPSVELAQLFSDGGIGLWERGMTREGLDLLMSAEAILDQLDCNEDLLRANIHVIISLLIQTSGLAQIAECKARSKAALNIRQAYLERTPPEKYTKNDEILLYNAWSDYGCVLLQYNNFQEAEPIFASCFEKYKAWDPPEKIPYEYAKYYHHMAFCLMYSKKFEEAIEMAKKGLHWVTEGTGQGASHYRWKFDLACIVLQSGDLERALLLHQDILDYRVKQYGSSAFLTLQSRYAVAATQAYKGDLASAEKLMRQVLTLKISHEDSFPEAAIARTKFHLSEVLKQQQKNTEEVQELVETSRQSLKLLSENQALDPLKDVKEEHELALFDHLQPVFDGRFTGRHILEYLVDN